MNSGLFLAILALGSSQTAPALPKENLTSLPDLQARSCRPAAAFPTEQPLTPAAEEEGFFCSIKGYSPNRDLRPEASLMEPSKALFFPHLLSPVPVAGANREALAVEVEFNEAFFPWQNRPSALDLYFGGSTAKFAITPMYRVRILKARSAPVRVPSFMPKGTFFRDFLTPRERGYQWGEGPDGDPKSITIHTLAATVGHHSNGQDGCLFADASGKGYPTDAKEGCPTTPDPATIRINRVNGSFSTNYAEVSYFFRRLRLAHRPLDEVCTVDARGIGDVPNDRDCDRYDDRYDVQDSLNGVWNRQRRAQYSWLVGATFQWNPPFSTFGGALEKPVRAIYGMNRLRVSAAYEKYWGENGYTGPETKRLLPRLVRRFRETGFKTRAWAEVTDKSKNAANCVLGTATDFAPACAPRFSWGVDLTIGLLSKADGLGIYARYMRAQDYYNLAFSQRKENSFQLGLSFSLSRSRGQAFPVLVRSRIDAEKDMNPVAWKVYRQRIKSSLKASAANVDSTQPPR